MPKARDAKMHGQGATNGQTVYRSSSFSPESHQCTMHERQIDDQDSPVLRELQRTQSKLQLMYRAPCRDQAPGLRSSRLSPFELSLESLIHNIKHLFHDSAATPRAAFGEVQTARGCHTCDLPASIRNCYLVRHSSMGPTDCGSIVPRVEASSLEDISLYLQKFVSWYEYRWLSQPGTPQWTYAR